MYRESEFSLKKSYKTWNLAKNIGSGGKAAMLSRRARTNITNKALERANTTNGFTRLPKMNKIKKTFEEYKI